ncbi:MAG: hypothetical protein WCJ30_26570, partial [Deltaproteobacteria bacterium]
MRTRTSSRLAAPRCDWSLFAALLIALLCNCHWPRTELAVVVDVDLDPGPGRTIDRVAVAVVNAQSGAASGNRVLAVSRDGSARTVRLPLVVIVTPQDGVSAPPVRITAYGCAPGEACPPSQGDNAVVQASASVAFVRGETRELRLRLAQGCRDERCGAGQTCDPFSRLCRSDAVEVNSLPAYVAGAPARSTAMAQIVAGASTTCIRRENGTVTCWGGDDSAAADMAFPGMDGAVQTVPGLAPSVDLSVGHGHACSIDAAGGVWCWGRGGEGQCGEGARDRAAPERVAALPPCASVSAGHGFTCAVDWEGVVWCWGTLAPGVSDVRCAVRRPLVPTRVLGIPRAIQVSSGGHATCALAADSSVWCWGLTGIGSESSLASCDAVDSLSAHQLMLVQADQTSTPATDVRELALGDYGFSARRRDGSLLVWGHAQLNRQSLQPWTVEGEAFIEVRAGDGHFCARMRTGILVCWGRGDAGQV